MLFLAASASASAAHLDLAPNTWRDLGHPAPDPVHGSPRGRSWAPRMTAAPDGGGFLVGAARHGAVNAAGYYQDDLWFYSLADHAWQTLRPGSHVATLELTLDARGVEVDATGQPTPVAHMAHGYNLHTFDTLRRRLVILPNPDPEYFWIHAMPQRAGWLGSEFPKRHAPWFFDAATGQWGRDVPAIPSYWANFEGTVDYIPHLDQLLALRYGEVWWYDLSARLWTKSVAPANASAGGGYDSVACYHEGAGTLYVGKFSTLSAFDVDAESWRDVSTDVWVGSGTGATLTCDTAHGIVLSRTYGTGRESLRAFDVESERWGPALALPPRSHGTTSVINGYYDATEGLHVWHDSQDSQPEDPHGAPVGRVFVYRYGPVTHEPPERPRNIRIVD